MSPGIHGGRGVHPTGGEEKEANYMSWDIWWNGSRSLIWGGMVARKLTPQGGTDACPTGGRAVTMGAKATWLYGGHPSRG
jgi:hypothetical protein